MSIWRRPGLVPGIYDEIVTARVQRDLDALPASLAPDVQALPEKADLVTPVAALVREALDAALDDLGGARCTAPRCRREVVPQMELRRRHLLETY